MTTTWRNSLLNILQLSHLIVSPTRRRPVVRCSMVEGLESRALLSASSGQAALADVQIAEVVIENGSVAPEFNVDPLGLSDAQDVSVPAVKIGKLNHHQAKLSKQSDPVYDFSGDWQLGLNGDPPSNDNVLHGQQVGRKIIGTISSDYNFTLAIVKGRITGNQLDAHFKFVDHPGKGRFIVDKFSTNGFQGTMSVRYPKQPLVIGEMVGLH